MPLLYWINQFVLGFIMLELVEVILSGTEFAVFMDLADKLFKSLNVFH
jgi:hypothetical protein